MSKRPLYQALASKLQARNNCIASGNTVWRDKHTEAIEWLVERYMPRGSGFDNGTEIDLDSSDSNRKLVFGTRFHHMNECGSYDGWTQHHVFVTASLANGFNLHIDGRNLNDIKEYIAEVFNTCLKEEIDEYEYDEKEAANEPHVQNA